MSKDQIFSLFITTFPPFCLFFSKFFSRSTIYSKNSIALRKHLLCNFVTLVTMEQYTIVEFDDGLQMIPSSWITENKKQVYWPPFTSNKRFSQAVQKCISKMDSWPLYEIKRILATAGK